MLARLPQLDASSLKALEAEFGAHAHGSILSQYFSYLGDLAHGNLGISSASTPPRSPRCSPRRCRGRSSWSARPRSSASRSGTLLGIFAAWRRGGWLDRTLPAFTFLQATPYFFLALIVIQLFSLDWRVFPLGQGYAARLQPGFNWPFISSAICAFGPAGAHDHPHRRWRLDAADAQRDDHDDLRGLRARRRRPRACRRGGSCSPTPRATRSCRTSPGSRSRSGSSSPEPW